MILVAVSLCFSAIQTREVARQSRINNRIGSANAILEINNVVQSWHDHLINDPSLRPYFFDGKPCPPDDAARGKVLTLAERFADLLECNLQMAPLLPAFTFAHTWYLWPARMLQQSPVLVEVVEANPGWWEGLDRLQLQIRAGGPLTHPLLKPPTSRGRLFRFRPGGGVSPQRDTDAATAAPTADVAAIPPQR